jgi:hypothetical protein
MPDRMPDRMPEDMSDRITEDMPDRMPEDMSDRITEDLSVRKYINVMVGIIRSEIIILITHQNSSFPFNNILIGIKI